MVNSSGSNLDHFEQHRKGSISTLVERNEDARDSKTLLGNQGTGHTRLGLTTRMLLMCKHELLVPHVDVVNTVSGYKRNVD